MRYGTQPDAYLFNKPRIYSGNELYVTEQDEKITEVSVEGAVLGLKRTVEEIRALEPLLNNVPPDVAHSISTGRLPRAVGDCWPRLSTDRQERDSARGTDPCSGVLAALSS